jgi:hypothetical protein
VAEYQVDVIVRLADDRTAGKQFRDQLEVFLSQFNDDIVCRDLVITSD